MYFYVSLFIMEKLIRSFLHKFIMRYNQLTYHKANPFYKQDFLPDRAWYNRKPKDFPSQIPTGQDYFTDNGRRHYRSRFNHSEIQQCGVLTSPQKYPYQNRIAYQKSYMRNLDTTDIEGAGSGTRVNQAVKNKLRAQEQLARRYNQSLDMKEHKQHQFQQKRRQLALKQYETIQERKKVGYNQEDNTYNSRVSQNPQKQLNQHANYQNMMLINEQYRSNDIKLVPRHQSTIQNSKQSYTPPLQQRHSYEPESRQPQYRRQPTPNKQPAQLDKPQQRNRSIYERQNQLQLERSRQNSDYQRTMEIQQLAKGNYKDRKESRKYNPTNLSFNIAAQSIVNGKL